MAIQLPISDKFSASTRQFMTITLLILVFVTLSAMINVCDARERSKPLLIEEPSRRRAVRPTRSTNQSSSSLLQRTSPSPHSYLPAPRNLSVVLVQWYPPAVRVNWYFDSDAAAALIGSNKLRAFQTVYHPVRSRYRIIQEVPPYLRNLTLDRLAPGTEYSLHLNSITEAGDINSSRVVHFVSPDNDSRRFSRVSIGRPIHIDPNEQKEGFSVREDEVVIVVLVICAWIGVIFVFFNKWGKIRMLEPYQPQYREAYHSSIPSIHPKPSRMNTCTSTVLPHLQSSDSRTSLIAPDRDVILHHARLSGSGHLYQCASGTTYHHPAYRPRLNSVFVGSPYHRNSLVPEFSYTNMPRKVKSAEDLKSLVVQVTHHDAPSTSTAVI